MYVPAVDGDPLAAQQGRQDRHIVAEQSSARRPSRPMRHPVLHAVTDTDSNAAGIRTGKSGDLHRGDRDVTHRHGRTPTPTLKRWLLANAMVAAATPPAESSPPTATTHQVRRHPPQLQQPRFALEGTAVEAHIPRSMLTWRSKFGITSKSSFLGRGVALCAMSESVGREDQQCGPDQGEPDPRRNSELFMPHQHRPQKLQDRSDVLQQPHRDDGESLAAAPKKSSGAAVNSPDAASRTNCEVVKGI